MTTYPQSKDDGGPHYWHVLFNVAATYPSNPSRSDKIETNNLIRSLISKFTCQSCIHHAFDHIAQNPIDLENRESLMKWMCGLKNNANMHQGKGAIDCSEFVRTSLSKDGGCKTCAIVPDTPDPVLTPKVEIPVSKKVEYKPDPNFESVWNWQTRYPSLKRSLQISTDEPLATTTTTVTPVDSMDDLSTRYPSLQGFETVQPCRQEELDGVLKPLDGLYSFPAALTDTKPHEVNLAYTPEMVANLSSLLSQMYLTNFGSLLTTIVSGLGLFGVSVLAKNSISHYDRIFIQNVVASLLFHSLNFINPRIKDEVIPSAQKFFEGITTLNFEKIKGAMLFNYENPEVQPGELMQMMAEGAVVDMDRLKVPKMSYMAGPGHSFAASSIRDMQSASQSQFDQRLGNMGSVGNGVAPSKETLERMYHNRAQNNMSSIKDYTIQRSASPAQWSLINQMNDKYDYILDNSLL